MKNTSKMQIEIGAPIIEFYGPVMRLGIEGKWVEFLDRGDPPITRRQAHELLEKMDRERTQ